MGPDWYVTANEDALFARLGEILLGDGRAAGGMDPGTWRRFGRDWFDVNIEKLQGWICSNDVVRASTEEMPEDVAAIAVLLTPMLQNQHLAWVAAAIIARRGLRLFCSTWNGNVTR